MILICIVKSQFSEKGWKQQDKQAMKFIKWSNLFELPATTFSQNNRDQRERVLSKKLFKRIAKGIRQNQDILSIAESLILVGSKTIYKSKSPRITFS